MTDRKIHGYTKFTIKYKVNYVQYLALIFDMLANVFYNLSLIIFSIILGWVQESEPICDTVPVFMREQCAYSCGFCWCLFKFPIQMERKDWARTDLSPRLMGFMYRNRVPRLLSVWPIGAYSALSRSLAECSVCNNASCILDLHIVPRLTEFNYLIMTRISSWRLV